MFEACPGCVQAPALCPVDLLRFLPSLSDDGRWDRKRQAGQGDQVKRSAQECWLKDLEEFLQQVALQTPARCSPSNADTGRSQTRTHPGRI